MNDTEKYNKQLEEMGPPEATFNASPKDIARTIKTSAITMVSDEITIFTNEHGHRTPILIVATCKLDNNEYAALFDTTTKKAYTVEVIRENGIIKYFKDLDGILDDEEWGVITTFFLDNNVFETNRIYKWLWNTRITSSLGGAIPTTLLKKWGNKKLKR